MIRVYGDSISGNCLKVKWTADYLGVPYQWIETDIMKRDSRTPEYLAMNPAGQVPLVVLDDERTLAQSNGIMIYLADGSDLIPDDRFLRGKMMEWLFWEQYSHEPYVAVARFQMRYLGKAIEDVESRVIERGAAALLLLDRALTGKIFLVGEGLSLADIALVAYTRVAHEGGFDLGDYPAIRGWIARVEQALHIA